MRYIAKDLMKEPIPGGGTVVGVKSVIALRSGHVFDRDNVTHLIIYGYRVERIAAEVYVAVTACGSYFCEAVIPREGIPTCLVCLAEA